MDNKQFLSEAHKYIDNLFVDFENYRKETNSLLEIFTDFCNKNDIKYFIAYGSLLGLIRDNGAIPWDYDSDVCVPITEVSKIMNAEDKLPKGYYFESNYSNKNSQFYQMRLLKEGTDTRFLHLDIFYLVGAPSSKEEIEKMREKVRKVFNYRFYWFTQKDCQCSFVRKSYNKLKLRRSYGHHSIKKNDRLFESLAYKYDYESSPNVMTFNVLAEDFEKDVIEPLKVMEVNGKEYLVPNDPDRYLKRLYKDYHSYLPIANRFNEFYDIICKYNASKGKNENELYRVDGDN